MFTVAAITKISLDGNDGFSDLVDVADLDDLDPRADGRHGPGRVYLPAPLPGGVRGTWGCGLYAVREACFADGGPAAPGFMAADGWTGRALARGATREAALDAWRVEVAEVRPFPEICGQCGWSIDSSFWNYCPWCKQVLIE